MITIDNFTNKIPYIYHLTDSRNLDFIKEQKMLYSTVNLVNMSSEENKAALLEHRRPNHESVKIGDREIWIRDQRPLNAALDKCLTDDWTREKFIRHLNARVFFWPNTGRLNTHFSRYANENPMILRIDIQDALNLNGDRLQVCRLNSGATRPNSYLGGVAPSRGPNTFVPLDLYENSVSSIVEVTFIDHFILPNKFTILKGPFEAGSLFSLK